MVETIPVIILNWNGVMDTLSCVDSVLAQDYPAVRVLLVDNGSDGDDADVLAGHFGQDPRVTLVCNTQNLGFTKGNNRILAGLLEAEDCPPFVFLLNNDTVIEPDCLRRLLACAQETGAGMVGARMVNYFDRTRMDNAGHRMLNTAEIIPLGHGDPVGFHDERMDTMGACAGAALYRTAMLRDIGLFDPFFDTGYEDAELGARAVFLGYRSVYEPTAVVYHKVSQSVRKVMGYGYLLRIQVNIFYTYFKLMPRLALVLNLPSLVFKYGMVLLIDILFFRVKFLRIMLHAFHASFFIHGRAIRNARRDFQRKHKPRSFPLLRRLECFLLFDTRRFFRHVVFRRKVIFENY
jgi:GT2 family glycosyltransferase